MCNILLYIYDFIKSDFPVVQLNKFTCCELLDVHEKI